MGASLPPRAVKRNYIVVIKKERLGRTRSSKYCEKQVRVEKKSCSIALHKRERKKKKKNKK